MKDFLLEEIFLVEEKNNGCVNEPFIVTDCVEQLHTFHHPEDKISDIDSSVAAECIGSVHSLVPRNWCVGGIITWVRGTGNLSD